ncbi:hypothetical protein RSOLAG1IB_10706 [Rhizoctonia solani AG-1 IB]|uniref:DUF6535 domain-containing protein n=1 Tax=Thanatephorus cucumeris (strain AG1-IB / isolate 7/3/14) TaxID=1108050 RepID=A0A0B7G076_THACB|nr:hypothetical protein RSOLAG1IB_10706 [Rhizoctonia solani AG-1 IB]
MSLVLPNNLSGGRHIAKDRKRTTDARGDPVPGLGHQATIEKIPNEEHCATDPLTKPHDAQQARYRVYQADDPMLEPDEYGAELTKDARVWKVYVKEADRWDAELVDGWNKFLIESSGMLKQDPNDVSAAALVVISHALVALAGNSSADLSTLSLPDQSASPFKPPHNAVVVNTLWYLSLATSIATSFLAMLAKDWCHSFATGRAGHPWNQAQRRQRKWMMIENWKMQELIVVLPSLIHLSLLLFAIGLCLYVWDLNTTTAIPVICIAGAAFGFYVWSSIVASMVEHFPYTTIVSEVLRSEALCGPFRVLVEHLEISLRLLANLVLRLFFYIPYYLGSAACFPIAVVDILLGRRFWKSDSYRYHSSEKFRKWYWNTAYVSINLDFYNLLREPGRNWIADTWKLLIKLLFKTHTDNNTDSYSLHWLIKHCETPSSVAVALQAIAGATGKIPKGPLQDCQSSAKILQRLVSSPSGSQTVQDALRYARALQFLSSGSTSHTEKQWEDRKEDAAAMVWELKLQHERNLVKTIGDGTFVATEQNLEALRIGNSASSHTLRLLQGDSQDAKDTMIAITDQLSNHALSGYRPLHPAAVQSLLNAASLLESCSAIPLSSQQTLQLCIDSCSRLKDDADPKGAAASSITPPLAALAQAYLDQRPVEATESNKDVAHMNAYIHIQHALRQSASQSEKNRDHQTELHWEWVQLYDLAFNPSQYGLDQSSTGVKSVKAWCDDYLRTSNPVLSSETPACVAAISRVYETVAPHDTKRKCLPEAVYVILVIAASFPQSEEQRAACMDVLSSFSFPSLSTELVQYVTQIGNHSGNRLVAWLVSRIEYGDDLVEQHFSATQLWPLLHLVGDSTTDTQKRLSQLLEDEEWLEIKLKGFDQVKKDLESRILLYYQADRLDTYSARIIECIHESSGTQPDDHTKAIMDQKLKDVPQSHRGLKQLIDDLDPKLPSAMGHG